MKDQEAPLLEVKDLKVSFSMYRKGLRKTRLDVIQSLSLNVRRGEIVAVVGSSGSGKSLLAHAVLGILPRNASTEGSIRYEGKNLTPALQKKLRGTEIALIPQSVDYLDPLMRVGKQVVGVNSSEQAQKAAFRRYELEERVERLYPFQLSGGMARRVLVSTAVTMQPKLIVADEPTPGLSVELAIETLRHFREFADNGAAVLLITHDIDLALSVADRIAVFYAGTTVELAPAEDFKNGRDFLRHPYSKAFIDALPQNGFHPIAGAQPYAGNLPSGCLFAQRCSIRTQACSGEIAMRNVRGGEVRCIHAT
ncbi:ABC transporter ATP-binding protein [Oscillospiraceae bacterium MB08-C2-2]|nr:ABC transporter ATP-binding protein [Oscillospiraceae bacterium MB08-C2-2]